MNITEIIPDIEYSNSQYKFKNVFYKYFLRTPIEEKYLQVYRLSDNESLEDVSYNMYGDTSYFWTIMIVNNFVDPIFDIALSESAIQEMAKDLSKIDGVLDSALYFSTYEELSEQNDAKRTIKVVKTEYLNKFLTELIRAYESNI